MAGMTLLRFVGQVVAYYQIPKLGDLVRYLVNPIGRRPGRREGGIGIFVGEDGEWIVCPDWRYRGERFHADCNLGWMIVGMRTEPIREGRHQIVLPR